MAAWKETIVSVKDVLPAIQAIVGRDVQVSVRMGGNKILGVEIPGVSQTTFDSVMSDLRARWPECFRA